MIDVIWGSAKDKPISAKLLADEVTAQLEVDGHLYIGYPVIGSLAGPARLDALLVSPALGLIAFDLVEGTELGSFQDRQDEIASLLEVRLKPHAALKKGRNLKFDINVVTFAPAKNLLPRVEHPYIIANQDSLIQQVRALRCEATPGDYQALVAAIQVVTSIRAGRQRRDPKKPDSRGAKLKKLEDSIANLDQYQSQAVIETVDGVQRIRGLAGSGKTIILALKVAYLHAQNPNWRIAVTFNTRSLKEQFRRLINNFTIEQTGAEPDWDCVDILNAWGGPGDKDRDGLYHKFCRANQIVYYDFRTAKNKFGEGREFSGACAEALSGAPEPAGIYDTILIDEAQDLPVDFIRLCFRSLSPPGRLVYAYDELQSLTGTSVPPPEEIFGIGSDGLPLVRLNQEDGGPRQDIILEKCYRNSRPVLATAHALGFGIHRKRGWVQIFDQDSLWTDVGYVIEEGELASGKNVTLTRTPETSPKFLEDHSDIGDLIQFLRFDDPAQQAEYLIKAIREDIHEQELRPEDIVVINPDPLTTQKRVGPLRLQLFSEDINSELAGVTTSADVFIQSGSVTFTGIFRAKGNEAGMVYIINAQDCASGWDKTSTALARNRLFTAITRSKAWVRVLGVGPQMDSLIEEWSVLRSNEYKLRFRYPTDEEKRDLRTINRDLRRRGPTKRRRVLKSQRDQLLRAVESGELDADQLILELQTLKKGADKK